jgi:hypothetical protein
MDDPQSGVMMKINKSTSYFQNYFEAHIPVQAHA